MKRPLSSRERQVLEACLSVDFYGVHELRAQATNVEVVAVCPCGCPSIDFHVEPGAGMWVRVNAAIQDSYDGLFLYTLGDRLGGIEYVGVSDEGDPSELPDPAVLIIEPA